MKNNTIKFLCESAAMIALAFVLSLIRIFKLPFDGSVTACSMLPIAIIAYRRGMKWGILTAFSYSLLQFVIGLDSLQFATSYLAAAAIVILDYIMAYSSIGAAGMFRNRLNSQPLEMSLGVLAVCLLRYVCHVIAGCTVWAGVSIPTADGLQYSMIYNATYMLPETIITVIGAWYVGCYIDFISETLSVKHRNKCVNKHTVIGLFSSLCAVIVLLVDTGYIFSKIVNKNGFDITKIYSANSIIAVGGILLGVFLFLLPRVIALFSEKK